MSEATLSTGATGQPGGAAHTPGVHITTPRMLLMVWGALVCLTVTTVAVTWIPMGPSLALLVALGIAVVKASLVALFFMHLWWEKPIHATIFLTAILFVALFIGIVMMDSLAYRSFKIPNYAPAVNGAR